MLWLFALVATLLSFSVQASAREKAEPGPSDPIELEVFFDGLMEGQLSAYDIAGASVAVVRDGHVLLSKGYGFSDVARRRGVEADRTLFPIASVTKLFVATAVMQLVQDEELDLDQDVNAYLDSFQIPATYPDPITMRHLISHTAGFEDKIIGLFARGPQQLQPLGQTLRQMLPERVLPPGQLAAYSNYGVALAAFIVERVSGMPWETYIRKRILDPLGMRGTTMRQRLPQSLRTRLSKGYAYSNGRYRSQPSELLTLAPAGSASATASDMARFMIAHLENGDGVLDAGTVRRMHEPLFSHDPRVGSMLHGFYEMRRSPVRAIGHGGDIYAFHTLVTLIPEHRVGLFVAYNSERGAQARTALVMAFFKRYFPPYPEPLTRVPPGAGSRVREVTGTYLSTRRPHASILEIAGVFRGIRVRGASGGRIIVHGPFPGPIWMVEQEPYLFRETLGDRTLLFRKAETQRVDQAFFDHTPMVAFVRASAFETRAAQLALAGGLLSVLGSFVLVNAIAWWRKRRQYVPNLLASLARASAATFSLLFILCSYELAQNLRSQDEVVFGMPTALRVALYLPFLAIPFWLVAATLTAASFKLHFLSLPARLHHALVVASGAAFFAWLAYWNLLGG